MQLDAESLLTTADLRESRIWPYFPLRLSSKMSALWRVSMAAEAAAAPPPAPGSCGAWGGGSTALYSAASARAMSRTCNAMASSY